MPKDNYADSYLYDLVNKNAFDSAKMLKLYFIRLSTGSGRV